MKTTKLVFGTYRRREWERIVEIFEDAGVPFQEGVHVHTHGSNTFDRDTWYFYHLEADVTPDQEAEILRKRRLLQKRFG